MFKKRNVLILEPVKLTASHWVVNLILDLYTGSKILWFIWRNRKKAPVELCPLWGHLQWFSLCDPQGELDGQTPWASFGWRAQQGAEPAAGREGLCFPSSECTVRWHCRCWELSFSCPLFILLTSLEEGLLKCTRCVGLESYWPHEAGKPWATEIHPQGRPVSLWSL